MEVDDARDFAQAAIELLHSDLAIDEYRKIVTGLNVVSSELTQLEVLTSNVISSANAGDIEAVIGQSKNIEELEDKMAELEAEKEVLKNALTSVLSGVDDLIDAAESYQTEIEAY